MHNEAMFLDPDPTPDSQPHEEWRPSDYNRAVDKVIDPIAKRILGLEPEEATFGCYHPAANERGGCYAE